MGKGLPSTHNKPSEEDDPKEEHMSGRGRETLSWKQIFVAFLILCCLFQIPAAQYGDVPGSHGETLGSILTLALNVTLSIVWARSYAYFEGTRPRRGLIASASAFVAWLGFVALSLWTRKLLGWDGPEWVIALLIVFLASSLFASGVFHLRKA